MSQQQQNGLFNGSTFVVNNSANAIPVVDAILEACVSNNVLSVDLATQSLGTLTVQDTTLDGCVSNGQVAVSIADNLTTLNFGTGYINLATPFTANVISGNVINVLQVGTKQTCLFGRVVNWQSVADDTTANLYIMYSMDGTTFYRSSLGAIQFLKVASPSYYQYDFSRDWTTGIKYIGLMCDQTIDIDIGYATSS